MPEPLERKRERRGEERRESPRKLSAFVVVDGATRHDVRGELGLGGASFPLPAAPVSDVLQLELTLGALVVKLPGTVSAVRAARTSVRHVQLKFLELPTKTELALAKWLDGVE